MIGVIVTAIMALTVPHEIEISEPDMKIAEACVIEPEQPQIPQESEESYVNMTEEESTNTGENSEPQQEQEMPTPADEFAYTELEWQLLGVYHVTHYSAEACGNAIGTAGVEGGLVEGLSCAMPEAWMLGHTILIENYGFYRVDDISPDGVADIFHYAKKDAVGEDWQNVYLVE